MSDPAPARAVTAEAKLVPRCQPSTHGACFANGTLVHESWTRRSEAPPDKLLLYAAGIGSVAVLSTLLGIGGIATAAVARRRLPQSEPGDDRQRWLRTGRIGNWLTVTGLSIAGATVIATVVLFAVGRGRMQKARRSARWTTVYSTFRPVAGAM